jgi:hypothetical protein
MLFGIEMINSQVFIPKWNVIVQHALNALQYVYWFGLNPKQYIKFKDL